MPVSEKNALVVGMSYYEHIPKLNSPALDACAVDILQKLSRTNLQILYFRDISQSIIREFQT
ncbi:MAG: hypothetical protein H7A25_17820 [Leptospiraceae bacterium]|nr:hypothetical protein [Leptospiraceae bacterium]